MNWELDSILEQSITQIAEGKARVESCLLAYPALADDLGPLLVVSEELLDAPKPLMSPEAKARIEGQLLDAAVASGLVRRERPPLLRSLSRPRLSISLPKWNWAYSALAAVVIVVLLMGTTLVGAANALPGSPLYSVKLATEDIWLWAAPARDEPALHLRFAQRRLEEYQDLAEQGVYDESVLDAMVAHVDAALAGIEELPPAIALPLLEQAEEVVAGQQQALTAMLSVDLPAASRTQLDRFLAIARAQITRVQSLRKVMLPYATVTVPVLDLTLVPLGTPEPGEPGAEVTTPTSTLAPGETEELPGVSSTQPAVAPTPTTITSTTPTSTSEPSATPSAIPSPTPELTDEKATKETPPGQTKTPEPPGQTKTPKP